MMIESIWQAELECETLSIDKWKASDGEEMQPFFMRFHSADIEACIRGDAPKRRLLKWAQVSRGDFEEWCERRGIPLPEFWFPPGWKRHYEWPKLESAEPVSANQEPEPAEPNARSRLRVACQVIAEAIWREDPDRTIASMIKDTRIQKLGGAARFSDEAVRRWLSQVAPAQVKARVGRPKKKKPSEGT